MNVVHMNTITIFDLFINKKSIYLYYQLHTVGCIWWLNGPYRGNYLVTFFSIVFTVALSTFHSKVKQMFS